MDKIIEYMLAEDEGFGDITSDAVVEEGKTVSGSIVSKDEGILAGIDIVRELFEEYGINVRFWIKDGTRISPGDILISFSGDARTILLLERTALNLSMRMSGVATAANHYVDLVKDFDVRVAGTRKTSPAIAKFDKYALKVGGADTHRFSLDDMVLIKDNHIAAAGSIAAAVARIRAAIGHTPKIEVETTNLDEVREALAAGADIIMLDNMTPAQIAACKAEINGRAIIEVSGGVNAQNLESYCEARPDVISMGALTHSVPAKDLSLKIVKYINPR